MGPGLHMGSYDPWRLYRTDGHEFSTYSRHGADAVVCSYFGQYFTRRDVGTPTILLFPGE